MKLILSLLLICSSTAIFAQSKKTINKRLSLELKQVKATNDSLKNEYAELLKTDLAVHRAIKQINDGLTGKRKELMVLRYSIHQMKGDMLNDGFNPEEIVPDTELQTINSLVNDVDYDMESYKITSQMTTLRVKELEDISNEKIKVQNELLQEKINEYKLANENDLKVVFRQQEVTEDLVQLKTKASDQLEICKQAVQTFDDKYNLLDAKYTELKEKAEAERLKKLEEERKNAKNKKSSKMKYIPPVIVEEEPPLVYEKIDYTIFDTQTVSGDSDWTWDNADAAPQSPPTPSYSENSEIYEIVEEIPEFPGGWEAMKKFLTDNLRYPPIAKEEGVEGKVYMKFVVTNTGEVSNVNVVRGLAGCPECDAEAKRVIKMMPKWKPGMNKGKAVSCYFSLPIVFKLESK